MQAWEIPLVCGGVRNQQARTLGEMVSKLEHSGHVLPNEPVLLAGDFNEKHSEGMETRLGAKHVQCAGGCKTHARGELDHFYLRGGTSASCEKLSFRAVSVPGTRNPSDHAPIVTEMRFAM